MSWMRLSEFRCDPFNGGRTLSCKVTGGDFPDRLEYIVTGSDVPEGAPPTADFALAAMIYPAMMLGRDLIVEGSISRDLHFSAADDLQSLLASFRPRLNRVRVEAEIAPNPPELGARCGTGYSAGVDTFTTLAIYERANAPMPITDLAIFDVGAFGKSRTDAQQKLVERNIHRLVSAAVISGRGWYTVRTNLNDFYNPLKKASFQKTHSIRNASAAIALQDILGHYLYSSSYPYSDINSRNDDMAFIEPMLMPLLSTGHMRLVSAGSGFSRLEKMRIVSDYAPAYDALDVCVAPAEERSHRVNCSK